MGSNKRLTYLLISLHRQFHQFALTLEDATEFHIKGVLQATQGLSEILTAEAITTNSTWPFVTLSNFEVYVGNTRAQASSELIVVAPIVSKENLAEWCGRRPGQLVVLVEPRSV